MDGNDTSIALNSRKIHKEAKKGKTKIPKRAQIVLRNWLTEHFEDPYPSQEDKMDLAKEAEISIKQVFEIISVYKFRKVQNWFTNARGRIWRKTFNPEKFGSQIEKRLALKPKLIN